MDLKSEDEIKKHLKSILLNHFHIKEEAQCDFPDGSKGNIDFLLFPKLNLIKEGFDEEWLGIEVKSPYCKESVKKCLDAAWQALTYAQADFDGIKPMFILLFPPIVEFFAEDCSNKYKGSIKLEERKGEIQILERFLQKGSVGCFVLRGNEWKISFAGSRYFSTKKGRSKVVGLGKARRLGSRKKDIT